MPFTVYVLLLTSSKYYIGKTTDFVSDSFDKHLFHSTLAWTQLYKPISIIEQYETSNKLEVDILTKKYMSKYGVENVRGGSYSNIVLDDFAIKALENEFMSIEDKQNNFTTIEEIDEELIRLEKCRNNIETINKFFDDINNNLNRHTYPETDEKYDIFSVYNIKHLETIIKFEKLNLDINEQQRVLNILNGVITNKIIDTSEIYFEIDKYIDTEFKMELLDSKDLIKAILESISLNYQLIYRHNEIIRQINMPEYKCIPIIVTNKISIDYLLVLNIFNQLKKILNDLEAKETSIDAINQKITELLVKRLE